MGAWGEIRFATAAGDECPAREFIDSLNDADKTKVAALLTRMANVGRIASSQKFRKESGEIYAFKSHQIRIACFRVDKVWFLTHGFIKKVDKWPQAELNRANRIRNEHIARS